MTKGQKITVGFFTLFLLALALGMNSRAHAGIAPPTRPLPAAPSYGWCGTSQNTVTGYWQNVGQCPAPPPSACPAGRQTVAQVCYRYGPTSCINTDVTRFETIWGRLSNTDTTLDLFPSAQVFGIVKNMQKAQYIAAKFVAPAGPLNLRGTLSVTGTTPGPPTDYAISSRCGDFQPADWRCRATRVLPGGHAVSWKLPNFAGPSLCPIAPGQTYYLNIKITDPAVQHFDCSGTTCRVGIQNNHTP